MRLIGLNIQLRIGHWSLQLGNEHGRSRIILWRHHSNNGAFTRWQWDFRHRPISHKEAPFTFVCTGARIVPVQFVDQEDESILDAEEIG